MSRPFRFGVSIADAPDRAAWREQARVAEALGYDVLLVSDHLTDALAPIPALMAAADATTTLRVGSFVLANDFRHPALVAREAATVDLLTDGRFELGIGAGHMKAEFDEVGIPFLTAGTRVARLEESVQVVRALLDGNALAFAGEHYEIAGHRSYPIRPRVPLLVGGNGKRVLAIAARHADIVGFVGAHQVEGTADVALSHFSAAGLDDRLAIVRAAGGDRFTELELNVLVQTVVVTDDRESAAAELSHRVAELTPDGALESPFLLIGNHDQIEEDLVERRARFGISYVVVFGPAMEALAPVVDRLRGR
ncbi:MAG: LLM class F420-dependent oxidoreductase [Acidimicrobiia bacterium]